MKILMQNNTEMNIDIPELTLNAKQRTPDVVNLEKYEFTDNIPDNECILTITVSYDRHEGQDLDKHTISTGFTGQRAMEVFHELIRHRYGYSKSEQTGNTI